MPGKPMEKNTAILSTPHDAMDDKYKKVGISAITAAAKYCHNDERTPTPPMPPKKRK